MTYLTGWQLAGELGWLPIDPTWNDPVTPLLWLVPALWCLAAVVVVPLSWLAWLGTRLTGRQWWWTTVASGLAPFALLDLPRMV